MPRRGRAGGVGPVVSHGEDRRRIQTRIEREEFARGHRPPGAAPMPPRPAATTVVARPAAEGFEVLLLERPLTTRFAAGAFVFPGGVVDDGDADPAWAERLPEVPDAEPGACMAAIRELFEETGILLGDAPAARPEALARARAELLDDRRSFGDIARELELDFRGARLAYFARWITPERLSRRYDARFFFAALPDREAVVSLTPEHTSGLWSAPSEALERFRSGELPMLFPTWKTLESLTGHTSLEDALARMRATAVRSVTPKLTVTGETVRPVLPDEPGYDEGD